MKTKTTLAAAMALALGLMLNAEVLAGGFGKSRGGIGISGGFGSVRGGLGTPFIGGFNGTSFSTIWDLYLRGDIPVPPYFALHPPVYYSYPVPRTYGYSPFAYPPSVKTPEVLAAAPTTIVNPYVPSSGRKAEAETDQVTRRPAPRPLVVMNPYVDDSAQIAQVSH